MIAHFIVITVGICLSNACYYVHDRATKQLLKQTATGVFTTCGVLSLMKQSNLFCDAEKSADINALKETTQTANLGW